MKKLLSLYMLGFTAINFGAEHLVSDAARITSHESIGIKNYDASSEAQEKDTQTFAEWVQEKRGDAGHVEDSTLEDFDHCILS